MHERIRENLIIKIQHITYNVHICKSKMQNGYSNTIAITKRNGVWSMKYGREYRMVSRTQNVLNNHHHHH